eukprot:Clim_evm40s108 gene=Clim_evmTU40s108
MFACLIPGRIPMEANQVEDTKFLIQIPSATSIGHIMVTLTGQQPFPTGMGGSIYYAPRQDAAWQLLGHITNAKPSALFRIKGVIRKALSTQNLNFGNLDPSVQASQDIGLLGISIEPQSQIEQEMTSTDKQADAPVNDMAAFSRKMLESFYNYASSYAAPAQPGQESIPISTLNNWYNRFEGMLRNDPNFWKS